MSEIERSIRKKNKKTRSAKRNADSFALLLFLGGGTAAVGIALTAAGAVMNERGPASAVLFALGGLLILGGGLLSLIALLIRAGVIGQKRLVFRDDAVELVRGKGKGTVLGRLPYSNIATVEVGTVEKVYGFGGTSYRVRSADLVPGVYLRQEEGGRCPTERVLLIRLNEPKDYDTFWPDKIHRDEFDVVIRDNLKRSLNGIRQEIQDAIDRHVRAKTRGGRSSLL